MSRANTIRKKALEYARRQDWEAAIREYRRLAEIDQSNPNLYNELGDIHLKTGNRGDAYDSFADAIDAYAKVSLFNNAVAVCKKVLRIIPARYEVLAKLGVIRKRQGLRMEAESYCLKYLDALTLDPNVDTKKLAATAEEIAAAMSDCAVVLDRLGECLASNGLDAEAGRVLASLFKLYNSEGIADAREQVRERITSLGMGHLIKSEVAQDKVKSGPVITEDNLWTDSLSEGERMSVDSGAEPAGAEAVPMGSPDARSGDLDDSTVNLPDPGPTEESDAGASSAAESRNATIDLESDAPEAEDPDVVHVSSIIGDSDNTDTVDSEDFRSHYDLGMAYLEMNLFSDAVREYQLAARSAEFRVKSLEMIGLCFLKQNLAHLAIKQLTKGLTQIDDDDGEALGIKYNLGLAYEMVGDLDKAQAMFEDVYVIDVAFRDVAEKIAGFTSA